MRAVVVSGEGSAAAMVADEVVRQGGRAILLREGPRSCALRQPGGIEVVASRLIAVKGVPGSMLAVLEDGELECSSVVIVNDLRISSPRPPAEPLRNLFRTLPTGTVVLDLRGGPDRGGRAQALRAAIAMLDEGSEVVVLTDEVLAYGRDELLYRQAQRDGAMFIRPGSLEWSGDLLKIADAVTGDVISVRPTAVLSESEVEEHLADQGTVSMGPSATLRRGVLRVRANLLDDELATEARAAATLALRPPSPLHPAEVDETQCSACLTCVRICQFSAPYMNGSGKASVDPGRCRACGKCVAACAGKAITIQGSTDQELDARIMAAMEGR